eukprot:9389299-Heterocapsa_arctica.AAC.1
MSKAIDQACTQDDDQAEAAQPYGRPNIKTLRILTTGTPAQIKKELVKLHIRLRHLPAYRLAPLLRTAGFSGQVLEWAAAVTK